MRHSRCLPQSEPAAHWWMWTGFAFINMQTLRSLDPHNQFVYINCSHFHYSFPFLYNPQPPPVQDKQFPFFQMVHGLKKMWNTANQKSLFPYKAIKHPPNRWPAFGILKNPCWAVPSDPLPENLFSSWRNFWPPCSSIQAAGEPSGLVSCPPGLVGSPID